MEEKITYINEAYARAKQRGLCRSKREFAALLGVNESTISRAFAGNNKYLTDSLVGQVKKWESELENQSKPGSEDNTVKELLSAVRDMSATIRSQQETISLLAGLQKQLLKKQIES